MHQATLELSRSRQPSDKQRATLIIGTGKSHFWRLQSSVNWWPAATSGRWVRRTGATKFRQFSLIELQDAAGKGVAHIKEQPYAAGETFEGRFLQRIWIFETEGDMFSVRVLSCPPARKRFQLWETWAGALSYLVGQAEVIGFEIRDLETNLTAPYAYRGVGLSVGPPLKSLPKTLPGVSTKGPVNDFEAPGWMLADDFEGDATMQSANVGLGTAYSKNCFDFAGHVDNFPGFWARIPDLQTGHTIGLPSAGFSSGYMRLVRKAAASKP